MSQRNRCQDCDYRYAKPRSTRCAICAKRQAHRVSHNAHLKTRYGITREDYDKLLEYGEGKCWICNGGTSRRTLAVDHDHKTGMVRGLLCATCNKALRNFRDSATRFRNAADFLESDAARILIQQDPEARMVWADTKHGGTQ